MKLKVMNTLGGYGGYFREQNPIFAVDETRTALKGSGLQTPDSARLLRACVRYGRNTYLHNASGASAEACGK